MSYLQDIEAWRNEREEGLKRPFGWLSLAGLFFLSEGENAVGPDGSVVVPRAPGPLGSVVVGTDVRFVTPEGLWWPLVGDRDGAEPSVLRFEDVSLTLVWRQERWAIRLRDNQATTRTEFAGLSWYAPDPSWSLKGRWEAFDPPQEVVIRNVLGHQSVERFEGRVVVDTPAGPLTLVGQRQGDSVFLNFRDATSGKTTYGAGRFLYATVQGDAVTVDFNKAYSPPCAFTPFATCPLPPQANHIGFEVPVGELSAPGHH